MSASERGPDALLPVWAARLLGFAALASLGALEWQRMVAGLSSGRALLWVAAAVGAGAAVLACDRLPVRVRGAGTVLAAVLGLVAAVVVSGIDLEYLKPRRWGELVEGVAAGAQSLGTVRMPYEGVDPWPRAALELAGSLLLTGAALLACWPRGSGSHPPTPQPARGYPFMALIVLLVLVVSPVVSLGGTRPLLLGAAIAALTVCFLWLERLPLRPGIGVAALLGVALAGALPLAAVVDRGEPWFDYKAFAEGLGPDDPVRFSWEQSYGPITWPRDGNEVMRVRSDEPHYWKLANLTQFDGTRWREATPGGTRRSTASCATTGATSRAGSTGPRCRSAACARSTCRRPARSWRSRTRRGRCGRPASPGVGRRARSCAAVTRTPSSPTSRPRSPPTCARPTRPAFASSARTT